MEKLDNLTNLGKTDKMEKLDKIENDKWRWSAIKMKIDL